MGGRLTDARTNKTKIASTGWKTLKKKNLRKQKNIIVETRWKKIAGLDRAMKSRLKVQLILKTILWYCYKINIIDYTHDRLQKDEMFMWVDVWKWILNSQSARMD